jgi:(3,5-dihydroxyphenyl)acetyl-CoA 1,2-dioxygenase
LRYDVRRNIHEGLDVTAEPIEQAKALIAAGLPADEVQRWAASEPAEFPHPYAVNSSGLPRDAEAVALYHALGDALLHRLPPKPLRSDTEQAAAVALLERGRAVRTRFLRVYVGEVYAALTDFTRTFKRAEELVYAAAERYPGLVPTRAEVQAERALLQKDKDGVEIDQGLFLAAVLAQSWFGAHLVHAMLQPLPVAVERLPAFQRDGVAELGAAVVERRGRAGYVYLRNPRFLNAEDDATLPATEAAVDLVLLDPACEVGVLRGATVEHPRYAGRRVFSAGINLTRLYQGQISYLFYMTRDLGYVNKLYRGLTGPEWWPGEPETTLEKPWIAGVEAFAIGGGCQLLLVMDHVLAEQGSYFNLPARKEGIIPGAANLRLPRFVGDRLTRQGILFDRQFPADSPEGRLLCDEVVPPREMDAALDRAVAALTSSGVVSAAGNRKALRVAQEPLATFQAYMATYAREQAYCHFSPALIHNLEEYWVRRRPEGQGRGS